MKMGKAAILTAGLAGAIAVGVAITPGVRDNWTDDRDDAPVAAAPAPVAAEKPAAKTARPVNRRVTRSAAADESSSAMSAKKGTDTLSSVPVNVWPSDLRARVKDVLNPGAKLELAAADFSNAEDFVTVAHASRNTQVPFMVLKHRVLEEGRTLADAIHEFKPELDAKAEATRARAAAREDLSSVS